MYLNKFGPFIKNFGHPCIKSNFLIIYDKYICGQYIMAVFPSIVSLNITWKLKDYQGLIVHTCMRNFCKQGFSRVFLWWPPIMKRKPVIEDKSIVLTNLVRRRCARKLAPPCGSAYEWCRSWFCCPEAFAEPSAASSYPETIKHRQSYT